VSSDKQSQPRLPSIISSIVRAGLSSAPFTGGVASLWSDWESNCRLKRIELAIGQLGENLSRIKSFDPSQLGDAEMQLLEDALQRIAREHRQGKRATFVQILASNWINSNASFDERLLFQRAFDEFDPVHIQILQTLQNEHKHGKETVVSTDLCNLMFGENADEQAKFGVYVPALNKLAAEYGFVRRRATNDGRIMVGIEPEGLVFHLNCRLLPLGYRFLESISV
jgi:hypothetical protein